LIKKYKIVVLIYSFSQTGSPKVILLFCEWIKHNFPEIDLVVVALEDGPLRGRFDDVSRTVVVNLCSPFSGLFGALFHGLVNGTKLNKIKLWFLRQTSMLSNVDVLLANSLNSYSLFLGLRSVAAKKVVYVHEMDFAIDSIEDFLRDSAYSNLGEIFLSEGESVVGGSHAVSDILSRRYPFLPSQINYVQAFSQTRDIAVATGKLRVERGIASSHSKKVFTVGCCGSIDWRKGADIMVYLANEIVNSRHHHDIQFVWLGSGDGTFSRQLKHDIVKLNLASFIQFIPAGSDLVTFYSTLDIFALTSREDPFPLVMIEAAAACCPVVGFEGSGGISEFLKAFPHLIVPYLDYSAMADLIVKLKMNEKERIMLGDELRHCACSSYDISVQAPKLWEIVRPI
jgi:glycosyltransferase involved in cell wall biosynthesis